MALAFGNERRGCSRQLVAEGDGTFYLPMSGFSQSFNIGETHSPCQPRDPWPQSMPAAAVWTAGQEGGVGTSVFIHMHAHACTCIPGVAVAMSLAAAIDSGAFPV